jgi:hypothetical protein
MYPSRYSNGKKVSAAQYITELICEHKAQIDKLDLHYRFWLNKTWAGYYRNQIGSANKLLKKYSPKAIIQALNDTKSQKIYSLRAPHLISIIEKYQKIEDESPVPKSKPSINRSKDIKFTRKQTKNKNIISKLKDLDNED